MRYCPIKARGVFFLPKGYFHFLVSKVPKGVSSPPSPLAFLPISFKPWEGKERGFPGLGVVFHEKSMNLKS